MKRFIPEWPMNEQTGARRADELTVGSIGSVHLARVAFGVLLSLGCSAKQEAEDTTGHRFDTGSLAPTPPAPVSRAPAAAVPIGVGMQVSVERNAGAIEFRVEASQPFRLGAMPPVLVIGDKAFGRSKRPPDGRPDVLIFTIDAAEYATLPAGAEASIGYLSPSARLEPGKPASGLAPATGPRIRPSQVERNCRLGVLQDGGMEVLP